MYSFLFTAMSQVPSCKRRLLRCSLQHSLLSSNAWSVGCVLNLCSKCCFVTPSSAVLFLMPSPTCPLLYLLMFYIPALSTGCVLSLAKRFRPAALFLFTSSVLPRLLLVV